VDRVPFIAASSAMDYFGARAERFARARELPHARMTTVNICEVVITADDAEWLAGFTRRLVEDRLVACGHLIAAIRSIYRWEGAVHDEPEARVALHTRASLVPRIVERADAEHPVRHRAPRHRRQPGVRGKGFDRNVRPRRLGPPG
jgi:periplasmic divalent cation tolerance protein